MAKKNKGLLFIQFAWPVLAVILIVNSIVVTWFGSPGQINAWLGLLPMSTAIVSLMGAAAGGGPLVADQIKAKAGVLESSSEGK